MSLIRIAIVLALGSAMIVPPLAAQAPSRSPQTAGAGTVTLSLADYNRLLDRAEHPVVSPDPPPIPAVLASGDLLVRIAGERVSGTFRLEGEVFRTGMAAIPLVSGAALLDARLGEGPLPLIGDADTTVALVEGPRPFSIVLQWGAPLESAPGRASFVLPVPRAGTVSATFELPNTPADIRIEPGAITRTSAANGITRVEATLVPGKHTRVSWSSRQSGPAASVRDLRTHADVKTLVSVGEADLRLTALIDVTVVRGTPDHFDLAVPAGFAVTSASGGGLDRTEERPGILVLFLRTPSDRRHQFLVSLERTTSDGATLQSVLPTIAGTERETGEVAIEAVGTIELSARETDVLRRMDVREASAPLRSLARQPVLAALRYHRRGAEPPTVVLDVKRFPDAPVIAAVAERAVATTLVTAEGRTLTEVTLTMRNRAQPFLRVQLPAGARMVSADVAGESAKLAEAPDGTRVPLLRPGFRPNGPYQVSYVYVYDGQAFGKKGRGELALPKMDVPVELVEWEAFLPDKFRLKKFDGNAVVLPAADVSVSVGSLIGVVGGAAGGVRGPAPGQIAGRVVDQQGSALPGTTVRVQQGGGLVAESITDANGWFTFSSMPAGQVEVTAELQGFKVARAALSTDASRGRRIDFALEVGRIEETITVAAETAPTFRTSLRNERDDAQQAQAPSQNVFNLQRRVSGVLPVRIDVPRAGVAYRFARPLVLDEATTVSFEYKTR